MKSSPAKTDNLLDSKIRSIQNDLDWCKEQKEIHTIYKEKGWPNELEVVEKLLKQSSDRMNKLMEAKKILEDIDYEY